MRFKGKYRVQMNTKAKILLRCLTLLLFAALMLSGLPRAFAEDGEELTLNVALFPYVPDEESFQASVAACWEEVHPDVKLTFTQWDCYFSDPDEQLDVFVFDSVFLTYFARAGYLLPFPEDKIADREDFIPFTLEECRVDGELYALPQLLCKDLLYTRVGDEALAAVQDIDTLYDLIGVRRLTSVIPGEKEGLLINLADDMEVTALFLDAMIDVKQEYTQYEDLPAVSSLSEDALEALQLLCAMGGRDQVTHFQADESPYLRGNWFAGGRGRAFIGYSEAMAAMGEAEEEILFRPFSLHGENDISLFFVDLAGINAAISPEKVNLAYDLVNIITGTDALYMASLPSGSRETPQYCFLPRSSVYDLLGERFPVYLRLKEIAEDTQNHVFRMGEEIRPYLPEIQSALKALIFP